MEEVYHQHYIEVDDDGRIMDGWSDGPHPERNASGAVCINERGGYQFRIFEAGQENPPLYTTDGIPMYRWDGGAAAFRTEAEIAADRAALPAPPPTTDQRLDAIEAAIERGLSL